MQDAWVVDQQKEGSWTEIGYTAPTSKNFSYNSTTKDWYAEAQFSTDDPCDKKWSVDVSVATGESVASYKAETKCTNLTPNFVNIGASGTGS